MKQIKILQFNSFCVSLVGDFGIVPEDGPFASSAWTINDEVFKKVSGDKFAWIAPDGTERLESKRMFRATIYDFPQSVSKIISF